MRNPIVGKGAEGLCSGALQARELLWRLKLLAPSTLDLLVARGGSGSPRRRAREHETRRRSRATRILSLRSNISREYTNTPRRAERRHPVSLFTQTYRLSRLPRRCSLLMVMVSSSLLIQRVGTSHRSGGGSNANAARRVQPRRKTTELRGARAHHGRTSASLGDDHAPVSSPLLLLRDDDDVHVASVVATSSSSTSTSSRRDALRSMLTAAAAASCSLIVGGGSVPSAIAAAIEPLPFEELGGVGEGGWVGLGLVFFCTGTVVAFPTP
jgi:hypothetical protein